MGLDFTERCHVLFNRVVASLLCSLHECLLLLCKNYLPESQYFRKFQAPEHSSDLSDRRSASLTNRSTGVACIWDICLLLVPISICVYISGTTCRTSMNYGQKTLCFDESKFKSMDEIDQDTDTSAAAQIKIQVWKGNFSIENMLPSNIIRWKWYDDYVKVCVFSSQKWRIDPSAVYSTLVLLL